MRLASSWMEEAVMILLLYGIFHFFILHRGVNKNAHFHLMGIGTARRPALLESEIKCHGGREKQSILKLIAPAWLCYKLLVHISLLFKEQYRLHFFGQFMDCEMREPRLICSAQCCIFSDFCALGTTLINWQATTNRELRRVLNVWWWYGIVSLQLLVA